MNVEQSLLRQGEHENGSFAAYMTISLGLHVIVMVSLVMASGFKGCEQQSFSSRVIDVDLVSLPDIADAADQEKRFRTPKPEEKIPVPVEKSVSIPARKARALAMKKPTDKMKTSLKTKTFNPGRSVENAIARLEKQVEKQPAVSEKKTEQDSLQSVTVSDQSNVARSRTPKELEAIEIYKLDILYHIKNNWVYSSQLAGTEENLKTAIVITIAADGRITDIRFDQRSNNVYCDNSVHKAVIKSNPLPRLPEGYTTYTVRVQFNTSDLR